MPRRSKQRGLRGRRRSRIRSAASSKRHNARSSRHRYRGLDPLKTWFPNVDLKQEFPELGEITFKQDYVTKPVAKYLTTKTAENVRVIVEYKLQHIPKLMKRPEQRQLIIVKAASDPPRKGGFTKVMDVLIEGTKPSKVIIQSPQDNDIGSMVEWCTANGYIMKEGSCERDIS